MAKKHTNDFLDRSRLQIGDDLEAVPLADGEFRVKPVAEEPGVTTPYGGRVYDGNVKVEPYGSGWYTDSHPSRVFGATEKEQQPCGRLWRVWVRIGGRWEGGVSLPVSKKQALVLGYSTWKEMGGL